MIRVYFVLEPALSSKQKKLFIILIHLTIIKHCYPTTVLKKLKNPTNIVPTGHKKATDMFCVYQHFAPYGASQLDIKFW
jgi:hypothetical protein